MILDYKIQEKNSVQIISLTGELIDKNQTLDLVASVDELLKLQKNKFVVDVTNLKYMNSSGLNVLIQLLTKTRNNGGDCIICGTNKKVNDLLVITKLNTLFKVVDTQDNAFDLFQN